VSGGIRRSCRRRYCRRHSLSAASDNCRLCRLVVEKGGQEADWSAAGRRWPDKSCGFIRPIVGPLIAALTIGPPPAYCYYPGGNNSIAGRPRTCSAVRNKVLTAILPHWRQYDKAVRTWSALSGQTPEAACPLSGTSSPRVAALVLYWPRGPI